MKGHAKSTETNNVKTLAPRKTSESKSDTGTGKSTDTAYRQRMIEEAAYYLAQQRGFQSGAAMDDWLAAETQINAQLSRKH